MINWLNMAGIGDARLGWVHSLRFPEPIEQA